MFRVEIMDKAVSLLSKAKSKLEPQTFSNLLTALKDFCSHAINRHELLENLKDICFAHPVLVIDFNRLAYAVKVQGREAEFESFFRKFLSYSDNSDQMSDKHTNKFKPVMSEKTRSAKKIIPTKKSMTIDPSDDVARLKGLCLDTTQEEVVYSGGAFKEYLEPSLLQQGTSIVIEKLNLPSSQEDIMLTDDYILPGASNIAIGQEVPPTPKRIVDKKSVTQSENVKLTHDYKINMSGNTEVIERYNYYLNQCDGNPLTFFPKNVIPSPQEQAALISIINLELVDLPSETIASLIKAIGSGIYGVDYWLGRIDGLKTRITLTSHNEIEKLQNQLTTEKSNYQKEAVRMQNVIQSQYDTSEALKNILSQLSASMNKVNICVDRATTPFQATEVETRKISSSYPSTDSDPSPQSM